MPSKIRMTLLFVAVFTTVALFAAIGSATDNDACPQNYPCQITNFDSFLQNQCGNFFNPDPVTEVICEEIPQFDFEKLWYVVAIGREAVRNNDVEWNGTTLFSTEDCSNWGLYAMIDFDLANLIFKTNGDTYNLDPFVNNGRFRVCQLTQDSNQLIPTGSESSYLAFPTTLLKGDLIIGFEDLGDGDYDDLIVALRARNTRANPRFVIEKDNSSESFDGEDFCFIWTNNDPCEAKVYGCDPGQVCDPGAENTCIVDPSNGDPGNLLTGEPIGQIVDTTNGDSAVFFGLESGACKPVYIKFGENSTRCPVIGGVKYCR